MVQAEHSHRHTLPDWLRLGLVTTVVAAFLLIACETTGLSDLVGHLGDAQLLGLGALSALGGVYAGCVVADHLVGVLADRTDRDDGGPEPLVQPQAQLQLPEPSLEESPGRTFRDRITAELAAGPPHARGR